MVAEPVEATIGLFLIVGVSTGSTTAFHPQASLVAELVEATTTGLSPHGRRLNPLAGDKLNDRISGIGFFSS